MLIEGVMRIIVDLPRGRFVLTAALSCVTRGLDPRVHPSSQNAFLQRRWIAPQLGLARVAQHYAPQVG
jgi:hypothetical protein